MYSANMSLQRIFYDGFNTRNPELTNVTNPGDPKKHHNATQPTVTARPYATPAHEKLAISLLTGSLGLIFLCFSVLPIIFPPNYDDSWEVSSKSEVYYPRNATVNSYAPFL